MTAVSTVPSMRMIARVASGVAVLAAALVAWPMAAHATPADGGLGLDLRTTQSSYRPGDPVRLTFAVTNSTGAACGLAKAADGAVRVTSVRRDGQDLVPVLGRSFYDDGISAAAISGMATVEPGTTVTVSLASVRVHAGADPGDVVLRSVAATPDGGGLDTLWPVGVPGRYEVTASYAALPVTGAVTPCPGATALRTTTFTVGDDAQGGARWLWLGGALLALVLGALVVVLLLLLLMRRRRRHRNAAAAVALVLIAAGVLVGGEAGPPGPTTRSTRTPASPSAASTSRARSTTASRSSPRPAAIRRASCLGSRPRASPGCGSSPPAAGQVPSRPRAARAARARPP